MNKSISQPSAGGFENLIGSMVSRTAETMKGSKSGISQFALFRELRKAHGKTPDMSKDLQALLKKINTAASKQYLSQINDLTAKTKRCNNA